MLVQFNRSKRIANLGDKLAEVFIAKGIATKHEVKKAAPKKKAPDKAPKKATKAKAK